MGAFFICRDEFSSALREVDEMFAKCGLKRASSCRLGNMNVVRYRKAGDAGFGGFFEKDGDKVFSVGTFIYKGCDVEESLAGFLKDCKEKCVEEDRVIGSHMLLLELDGRVYFRVDGANIQNLFFRRDLGVMSTSFLAVAVASSELALNQYAVIENLVTGHLHGPDTIFNEIARFDLHQRDSLDDAMLNINEAPKDEVELCIGKFSDCVNEQIEVLDRYFRDVAPLANRVGVSSGLTGGHDSRMIFAIALKYFENIRFFAHPRKRPDLELQSAEALCKEFGLSLVRAKIEFSEDMDDETLRGTIFGGMFHNDGLVRENTSWLQQTNVLRYKRDVLAGNGLMMGGVGGEQYRNEEHYVLRTFGVRRWMKNELMYPGCAGQRVTAKDVEGRFVDYFRAKIERSIGPFSGYTVPYWRYKRYLNEVYIPAGLGLRNNIDGRVAYFLSPFADHFVSRFAYRAIPRLGFGLEFEEEMIRRIDSRAAAVISDEGYDYKAGEPLRVKAKFLVRGCMPGEVWNLYAKLRMRKQMKGGLLPWLVHNRVCREYIDMVPVSELGLNRGALLNVQMRAELLVELGALLAYLGTRVRF